MKLDNMTNKSVLYSYAISEEDVRHKITSVSW